MGLPDQSDMHPTDRLDSYAMNKDQRLYTQAASALAERRKSPRTAIHRPAYINFEPYNRGGVITDISETGLRFHTVDTLEQGGIVRVSIFLGAAGHIEVVGELMWKDATQRIGGLRFTVLPAGAADQIRVWAEASNGAEVSGADISGMPPLPAENREAPASNLASSQSDAAPVANNGALRTNIPGEIAGLASNYAGAGSGSEHEYSVALGAPIDAARFPGAKWPKALTGFVQCGYAPARTALGATCSVSTTRRHALDHAF